MDTSELLRQFKRFWHFVWHDDSMLSWVLSIAFAFILIKFLVYPGLAFIFQTGFPIVAVISGSMEHDGSFDEWWNSETALCDNHICTQKEYYAQLGIDETQFQSFVFKNGFNTGDIIVLHGYGGIEVGDVIVFQANRPAPIIHRVVAIHEENGQIYYQTKGDHNQQSIGYDLNELRISEDRIYGEGFLRVPYLGWVKLGAVKGINWLIGLF